MNLIVTEPYLFDLIEKEIPYQAQQNSNFKDYQKYRLTDDYLNCFLSIENLMFEENLKDKSALWIWNYLRSLTEFVDYKEGALTAKSFVRSIFRKSDIVKGKGDLVVDLDVLSTKESGRISAMATGCSGIMDIHNSLCSIYHMFENNGVVFPGESIRSFVSVKFELSLKGALKLNDRFVLREGSTVTGYGKIIEIMNPNLICP